MDKKRLTQKRELCETVSAFGKIQVPGRSPQQKEDIAASSDFIKDGFFCVFTSWLCSIFGRLCGEPLRLAGPFCPVLRTRTVALFCFVAKKDMNLYLAKGV